MISQKVAILDAGSQFGKLIDRRVRELNCYTELLPLDADPSKLSDFQAIIISGGPNSLYDPKAPKAQPGLLELGKPILGICYGMQWLNLSYGGKIETTQTREDGQDEIEIDNESPIFAGLEKKEMVLLTHGDSATELGKDLKIIGKSAHAISAVQHASKPFYGFQFHPEVDLSVNGKKMFKNFLYDIAGLKGTYTMDNLLEKNISELQKKVGDKEVVVLISGGVDSSVCCALLYKALGPEKVHGIHIDTGFMRKNESALVKSALESNKFKLDVVDAVETFANATTIIDGKQTKKLKETTSPEEKRKIIGDTFMRVTDEEIKRLNLKEYFLAQGTLRPDLIESASIIASGKADTIKTHHNDTALVREKREQGMIVEPLCDLHKDEVRQLGRMLGLPEALVDRQPFPGPGLSVRTLCAEQPYITEDFEDITSSLTKNFKDDQTNLTLLPIRSVGVQGDGRTYSYVVGLSGKPDWQKLFKISKAIPKTVHGVNRIVYVFGEKVEKSHIDKIAPTFLVPEVVDQLREADAIVTEVLKGHKDGYLMKSLSQVPVILAPVSFDEDSSKRSIAIRTFITNDFMTGVPAIPGKDIPEEVLTEIVERILKEVKGISRVMFDLTPKPPGTTEWE